MEKWVTQFVGTGTGQRCFGKEKLIHKQPLLHPDLIQLGKVMKLEEKLYGIDDKKGGGSQVAAALNSKNSAFMKKLSAKQARCLPPLREDVRC